MIASAVGQKRHPTANRFLAKSRHQALKFIPVQNRGDHSRPADFLRPTARPSVDFGPLRGGASEFDITHFPPGESTRHEKPYRSR